MNLFPHNKRLFTISFILYLQIKKNQLEEFFFKGVFVHKLLNNTLAPFSLINLNLLVRHAGSFDKISSFPLFLFATLGFLLSVFSLNFKQLEKIVLLIN